MTAPHRERQVEFEPIYHHYGPHRAGLPPLIPYFRELWHRRAFAAEMSKAVMRGSNTSTFFGQLWLILNPLLLAGVYYLLVTVIRGQHDPTFFTHLCLNLFAFNLVSTAINSGATSVTSSGKLLMNTPFPRLLIPLSAVRTAFFRFLPTVPVYFVFHLIFLTDVWHPKMLLSLYFLGTMVLFGMGCAAFFAALQVYFRDTSSFLPFFVRVWMYLSPVLWTPERIENVLVADRADAGQAEPDVLHARRLHRADPGARVPSPLYVAHRAGLEFGGRRHRVPLLHVPGA